jgi:hypothetical protein
MNQNINLYLPEFRKQPVWLGAGQMLQWVGVVAFVLALISAWQVRLQREKQMALAEAETAYQQLGEQVFELEAQLAGIEGAQSIDAEIERSQAQLRAKRVLLDFLEGRELGNVTGFAEYLADLSRYHMAGLSLHGIVLRRGGDEIELSGQVLRAELVPLYLQSLRQGQMYVGKNFQMLSIGEQPAATLSSATAGSESRPFWEFRVASGATGETTGDVTGNEETASDETTSDETTSDETTSEAASDEASSDEVPAAL